jgi:prolyl 4-hydroxylase
MRVIGLSLLLFWIIGLSKSEEETCSLINDEIDPALKEMTYDVGDGPKKFMAYVEPEVSSFYRDGEEKTKVVPLFNGLAAKFINLSNKHVQHYWESGVGGNSVLMRYFDPFSSGGTASFPGHRFYMAHESEPENRLIEWVVKNYPENIYVYDPYLVEGDSQRTEANLSVLNKEERVLYDKWRKNLAFNEQYKNFTGRSWLSNYDRPLPQSFMWRADYFDQEHWVTTKETHFVELPPAEKLNPIEKSDNRILQDSDPRHLEEYRVKDQQTLNMTLKVLSCAPRVFEIDNFLSEAEIAHILDLAGGINLKESTTGDVGTDSSSKNRILAPEKGTRTRTSFNSWIPRERSPILDAIYRRSADLLRKDESLLRYRKSNEYPELPTSKPTCESLQLVHYSHRQEYTAHHDFGYSAIDDKHNGARFATLLFYLNEGMEGGETSFPRWINGETFHRLSVVPKVGKAILFYSQLPDGNMDDFSQHAAEPIVDGEKWLINLWVWDPVYEI